MDLGILNLQNDELYGNMKNCFISCSEEVGCAESYCPPPPFTELFILCVSVCPWSRGDT